MLALEPYWGKPAVRDFRGDDGNVGTIRSPVRAIVLLDRAKPGEIYLIYLDLLATRRTTEIDLTGTRGNFDVRWFNPVRAIEISEADREPP